MDELFMAGFWCPSQADFAGVRDVGRSDEIQVDLKFFKRLGMPGFGTFAGWAADKIPALYSGTQ